MTHQEIENLHRRLAYERWLAEGSRPDTSAVYWEAVRPRVNDIVFWGKIRVRIKDEPHDPSGK